jgi:hypothetical protein
LGDVEVQSLKDVDFLATAAVLFVEVANLDEARLTGTAVDSDHFEVLL